MFLYLRALGLEHANLEGKVFCSPRGKHHSSEVMGGVRTASVLQLLSAEG